MKSRKDRPAVATAVFLFLPIILAACSATADSTSKSLDRDRPLAELAWMAGHWTHEAEGVFMEELWLLPRGRLMLGLHRDVMASGSAFFEYLRIEDREEGTFYLASPQGRPATPFKLIDSQATRAVFENKSHDFPQRILYRLDEKGLLHARIEGREKGVEKSMDWVYHRKP